mmetsp:Transcript_32004/g.51471  ORF Transcript_32004/g.51471 Transcript_32004/m.51471 type:complete len:205 (+) Transcript_32004:2077-2691(+)
MSNLAWSSSSSTNLRCLGLPTATHWRSAQRCHCTEPTRRGCQSSHRRWSPCRWHQHRNLSSTSAAGGPSPAAVAELRQRRGHGGPAAVAAVATVAIRGQTTGWIALAGPLLAKEAQAAADLAGAQLQRIELQVSSGLLRQHQTGLAAGGGVRHHLQSWRDEFTRHPLGGLRRLLLRRRRRRRRSSQVPSWSDGGPSEPLFVCQS